MQTVGNNSGLFNKIKKTVSKFSLIVHLSHEGVLSWHFHETNIKQLSFSTKMYTSHHEVCYPDFTDKQFKEVLTCAQVEMKGTPSTK